MIVKITKNALSVVYNNAKSKLSTTNVQDAIDEITTIQNGLLVTVDKSSWSINDDSEYVSNITVTGLSGNEMLDVDLYDDGTATEAQIELFDNIVEISTSKDTIKLISLIQPTVNITLAIRGKFSVDKENYTDVNNRLESLDTRLSKEISDTSKEVDTVKTDLSTEIGKKMDSSDLVVKQGEIAWLDVENVSHPGINEIFYNEIMGQINITLKIDVQMTTWTDVATLPFSIVGTCYIGDALSSTGLHIQIIGNKIQARNQLTKSATSTGSGAFFINRRL